MSAHKTQQPRETPCGCLRCGKLTMQSDALCLACKGIRTPNVFARVQ